MHTYEFLSTVSQENTGILWRQGLWDKVKNKWSLKRRWESALDECLQLSVVKEHLLPPNLLQTSIGISSYQMRLIACFRQRETGLHPAQQDVFISYTLGNQEMSSCYTSTWMFTFNFWSYVIRDRRQLDRGWPMDHPWSSTAADEP